ncbi:hypothetical protein PUN28_015867 [Cardiocondyla obscurior]|uniref:Uncharacterized protein n=1 Tax=Cardiocondyla obscurior TaxID=286306 RepID=A0AAW2ES51_9HYME
MRAARREKRCTALALQARRVRVIVAACSVPTLSVPRTRVFCLRLRSLRSPFVSSRTNGLFTFICRLFRLLFEFGSTKIQLVPRIVIGFLFNFKFYVSLAKLLTDRIYYTFYLSPCNF